MTAARVDALIRPALRADAAALAALVGSLGYPCDAAQMRARLGQIEAGGPARTTFVAEIDGRLLGLIGLEIAPSYTRDELQGRITVLVVEPAVRGHGHGRRLVAAGLDWLAQHGAAWVIVTTRSDRAEAHAFYRQLGFEQTGLRFAREFGRAVNEDSKNSV